MSPVPPTSEDALERVARLLPDLAAVWDAERGPSAHASRDQSRVAALEAAWPELTSRVFGVIDSQFEEFLQKREAGGRDPVSRGLDLLSPMGLALRETTHTQLLRFFLDPCEAHGLGEKALVRVLQYLAGQSPVLAEPLLSQAITSAATARVFAEWSETLAEEVGGRKRPRTDLWIELPAGDARLLVVIENKIEATVQPGQLEAYDALIERRASRSREKLESVRVLLTMDGEGRKVHGSEWSGVSLLELAGVLSALVAESEATEGAEYLSMYLATVVQGLYRIRADDGMPRVAKARLVRYWLAQRGERG